MSYNVDTRYATFKVVTVPMGQPVKAPGEGWHLLDWKVYGPKHEFLFAQTRLRPKPAVKPAALSPSHGPVRLSSADREHGKPSYCPPPTKGLLWRFLDWFGGK